MEPFTPTLVGRSSSHFTRLVRIVAAELGVACAFEVLRDIGSPDPADYGGHPGLKIPVLKMEDGALFGSLPICRELARRARTPRRIVWPEALTTPLLSNAQEIAWQAMSTDVSLVMSRMRRSKEAAPDRVEEKIVKSLEGSLAWLDAHLDACLAALPLERELSLFELSLVCLVEHLEFRQLLPVEGYRALAALCRRLGERPAVAGTAYRFDDR